MTDGHTVSARSAQRMKGRKGGPPKGKSGSAPRSRASFETTSRDQSSRGCSVRPRKPAAANGSQTLDPTLPTRMRVPAAGPRAEPRHPVLRPGMEPAPDREAGPLNRRRYRVEHPAAVRQRAILHPASSPGKVYVHAVKSADPAQGIGA